MKRASYSRFCVILATTGSDSYQVILCWSKLPLLGGYFLLSSPLPPRTVTSANMPTRHKGANLVQIRVVHPASPHASRPIRCHFAPTTPFLFPTGPYFFLPPARAALFVFLPLHPPIKKLARPDKSSFSDNFLGSSAALEIFMLLSYNLSLPRF